MTEASSELATDEASYPATGPLDQLRFLVGYAILAPSSHNTQPWRFVVAADRIELWFDPSRSLPAIDPEQRQLFMSCGAALMNLRLAIRRFGHTERVRHLPDPGHPDLIASVSRGEAAPPAARDVALFEAIVLASRSTRLLLHGECRRPPGMLAVLLPRTSGTFSVPEGADLGGD